LTIKSFLLYFHCLQNFKLLIKRLCFNIVFGISSIFVCTENIIKFCPTSGEEDPNTVDLQPKMQKKQNIHATLAR